MGLDLVEFVMAVEEKFGISITDEEAQETTTPGKLVDLVLRKVATTDQSTCLTQRAFHLLRRHAMAKLRLKRSAFRPDLNLEEIFPKQNRRQLWSEFGQMVGASAWPELVRPRPLVNGLALAVFGVSIGTAFPVGLSAGSTWLGIAAGVAAGAVAGRLLALATKPLRFAFPAGYSSVGDLAQYVVARNPQMVAVEPVNKWTREQVWCTVRDLVIQQLGVTEFTEDSRFVQDMKID